MSTIQHFFFFLFFLTLTRSGHLAEIWWFVLYLKITKNLVCLIFLDGFWVMHIPFVRLIKFKLLAQFPLDHLAHLVVSSLILSLLICSNRFSEFLESSDSSNWSLIMLLSVWSRFFWFPIPRVFFFWAFRYNSKCYNYSWYHRCIILQELLADIFHKNDLFLRVFCHFSTVIFSCLNFVASNISCINVWHCRHCFLV